MRVGILMSTFNGEQFVDEQIESILRQTYRDFTLYIRDDGSSDSTAERVDEWTHRDSRVQRLGQDTDENLGVVGSFMCLLNAVNADIYFFSDQDDVWYPEKLARTLEEFARHDQTRPLAVYTDLRVVDVDLNVIESSQMDSRSGHPSVTAKEVLLENTAAGCSMAINQLVKDNAGSDINGIYMHDWWLALVAACLGELVYLPVVTVDYRQHRSNAVGSRSYRNLILHWRRLGLLDIYWDVINGSVMQAKRLIMLDSDLLDPSVKRMVIDYILIRRLSVPGRIRMFKKWRFRKNRWLNTFIMLILSIARFGEHGTRN
jgi:rhamnosyltransferase